MQEMKDVGSMPHHLPLIKPFREKFLLSEEENKKKEGGRPRVPSLTDPKIFRLLKENMYLWRTPSGDPYVDVKYNDKVETWPLTDDPGAYLPAYIARKFRQMTGLIANPTAMTNAIKALGWDATYDGDVIDARIRVNGDKENVWIHVGCEGGNFIHVDQLGWQIKSESPKFKFLPGQGSLPLVMPIPGEDLLELMASIFHVRGKEDLLLLASWLIGAFKPNGPYPILMLSGEQGSAKSTTMRMLRKIVDPHFNDLRNPPKDIKDLTAMVWNSYVVAMDNISSLKLDLSDDLCGLATGTRSLGGRTLYTNRSESSFTVARPIMMNGIPDFIERGDLMDRAIQIDLPRVTTYKADDELWDDFNKKLPYLLGACLDRVSRAIRDYPTIKAEKLPRMSNFCKWAMASLGEEFLDIFNDNRLKARGTLLDYSPLATAIIRLTMANNPWHGTYETLHNDILLYVGEGKLSYRTPQGLSGEVRRLAPILKDAGVDFKRNGQYWGPDISQRGKQQIELRLIKED